MVEMQAVRGARDEMRMYEPPPGGAVGNRP